jgi:type IV pilus biogenesis protein CpaD/CtpE
MVAVKVHLVMIYKEIDMIRTMMVFLVILLAGCANDAPLGQSVAKLQAEQTYNPNATQENLQVLPDGTGERMQAGYDKYVGKGDEELSGSSSQVLKSFN